MDKTINGGEGHGLIWKDLAPVAEWLISGDQHGAPLVAASDQLEQHTCFGLVLANVGDVIKDQEVVLVELGQRAFEGKFAARKLQALDQIAGAHEQDAPSVLDEREPDGCCQMTLAAAGRAE